ncbi:methylmalonyl-CoA epimerase [Rhodocaloribacter litoris]|uniref:methylmalonyl-CoA epimerase n=1 Tax=Rhodocaloribacter litoris TaxID=2558931 RepID=UPI00141EB5E5|nr:methylmalonyl-CoA epimerase [Rhodocaloribacter litoris]QXD15815.1 methylmalonyl-CoA epimerase [Rhodocaloribacter litoris]
MPRLEHIGIAVRDPAAVAALLERLLETSPYKVETVEREGVRTHFVSAETAKLELLEAVGPDSPLSKFLEKRGEGLHHLAFEVEDLDATMDRLRALGFQPLSDTPRPGADGKRIFFLHPKQTHGVLVEFCQSTPAPFPAVEVRTGTKLVTVHTAGSPAAPPLVLFSGEDGPPTVRTRDASGLDPLVRRLEPHFHVLIPEEALDTETFPAVLDRFGHETAYLLGYANGCTVAQEMARHRPDRIRRLALCLSAAPVWPGAGTTRPDVPTLVISGNRPAELDTAWRLHAALPRATLAVLPETSSPAPLALDALVAVLRHHFTAG